MKRPSLQFLIILTLLCGGCAAIGPKAALIAPPPVPSLPAGDLPAPGSWVWVDKENVWVYFGPRPQIVSVNQPPPGRWVHDTRRDVWIWQSDTLR